MSGETAPAGAGAPAFLRFSDLERGTRRISVEGTSFTIGRSRRSDLKLNFLDVSRAHCSLHAVDGGHELRDEGSRHGTRVNDSRVEGPVRLRPGDVIGIGEHGHHQLTYEVGSFMGHLVESVMGPVPSADGATALSRYRDLLPSLVRALSSTLDLDSLLGMVVDAVLQLTRARRGYLVLEERRELAISVCRGTTRERAESSPVGAAIVRKVMRSGLPIAVAAGGAEDARPGQADERPSIFCFPLKTFEAERQGGEMQTGLARTMGAVFSEADGEPSDFAATDRDFVQTLCDLAAVQVANARLYERATRDALTGLYNRGHFENNLRDRMDAAEIAGRGFGLAILDLDHFKQVNDTHGHDAGDRVLQEAAEAIRAVTANGGQVFRYGGEEFAILFHVSPDRAEAILEDVRAELERAPVVHAGKRGRVEIPVTASAGLAFFPGPGIAHRADLVQAADRALYRSKEAGRNRVTVHGA